MNTKPGIKLEMIYMDHNNRITQRTIKVLKSNEKTAIAYCYNKHQVRTFKTDNILSTLPIERGA